MSATLTAVVNTTFLLPFVSRNNDTGKTTFPLTILRDGVLYTGLASSLVWTEVGRGLYTLTLTFTDTGLYTFFIDNAIAAFVDVRARTDLSYLVNLEDTALGSWRWDKQTGVLTLYKVNGTVLDTFTMADSVTEASRARV
jgi:hypothetical protein